MKLLQQIESLLFVSGEEGISIEELTMLLSSSEQEVKYNILTLQQAYHWRPSALTIIVTAGRYKISTKKEFYPIIEQFAHSPLQVKLSQAVLETLIIIAYRQPITRVEIDHIRGVQSQAAIQRLILRGLIQESGRLEKPGRPKLYETTDYFLDYFGLNTIDDLPALFDPIDLEIKQPIDLFDKDNFE
ncbi:SMC-Scp complex subunit ScpB [Atopobacter phocae]|uniref:SMC-Scp complex subunit ScpB n=1 Tax=Atopobacter phocae TaxID=136492 RepID=UPI0004B1CA0C|nr:SMC-Scp complex subunit ScpB [Atopobacter phocae]